MKNNLKKIISSLAALTIASSVLVAPVSAADFSDVADTAEYKQAFDELYALGIVNGYEDGTIKPENNITIAEVTKLVVATMGPSYTEAAVGAGVTSLLFFVTLKKIHAMEEDVREDE